MFEGIFYSLNFSFLQQRVNNGLHNLLITIEYVCVIQRIGEITMNNCFPYHYPQYPPINTYQFQQQYEQWLRTNCANSYYNGGNQYFPQRNPYPLNNGYYRDVSYPLNNGYYRDVSHPLNNGYYRDVSHPLNNGYYNDVSHPMIRQNIVTLQNSANTQWKGHYLDIDGNTGAVILWPRLGSGGYWELIDNGNGTVSLRNTADTQWKGHYLDIDGNTGAVILWPSLGSGGYWKYTDHGNGTISLQNAANTQWKDHYLDIDGNTGKVILWPSLGSGGYWNLNKVSGPGIGSTPGPSETQQPKATLTKTIGSFHYPSPTLTQPGRMKLYRVYLEVKAPQAIANTLQDSLDNCMVVAKTAALKVISPFLTPATMAGLPGAIPAALGVATQAFVGCVASNPRLYPYANQIDVSLKSNKDA
jgi:DNA-binding cell septation regulator SpoVG